jgi:DUF4097 and DUF4098 domain-containing protein YvlB
MTTFETPAPIVARVLLTQGDLRVEASDRTDTVVEIRPSNPSKRDDVSAAERTTVELTDGRLQVLAPRSWRRYTWINDGSVDVRLSLPTGSELEGEADLAALGVTGRLGPCRFRTGMGEIAVDEIGPAHLRTGMGSIGARRIDGSLDAHTGSGRIRIQRVTGAATIKSSNGSIEAGAIDGDAKINTANGDISVDRAGAGLSAKSANGSIDVGAIEDGSISAQTAAGDISIGVTAGTAVYLDLSTSYGHVDNGLDAGGGPPEGARSAHVQARTGVGDVRIHRARPDITNDAPEGSPRA